MCSHMPKLNQKIDLICPAGNLPALRAAVDNGADAIYIGFRDDEIVKRVDAIWDQLWD